MSEGMAVPPIPLDQRPRSGPYSGLNYRSAKRFIARQLDAAQLPFADEDALDLVLGLTGISHTDYVVRGTDFLTAEQFDLLRRATDRRLAGEPVDRILGWRHFYGRRFAIDNVLSPRGDTEVLLLAAISQLEDMVAPIIADLGTGSGALALSLLCERTDARAVATDISEAAITTASFNAQALGVSNRVTFALSDWFSALSGQTFDAIVSNPPYITSAAMTDLEPEVATYDPHNALHGGTDGLDPYHTLVPGAVSHLKPGGWLGVEIGYDQGSAVKALFDASGFSNVTVLPDPAGLDRVVYGQVA